MQTTEASMYIKKHKTSAEMLTSLRNPTCRLQLGITQNLFLACIIIVAELIIKKRCIYCSNEYVKRSEMNCPASLKLYRNVFNIRFQKLLKDQCNVCISYGNLSPKIKLQRESEYERNVHKSLSLKQ